MIIFLLFTLLVIEDDGQLYTWGRGFAGASDTHVPQCVYTELSFSQAALGWNHALLLSGIAYSNDNDDVHIYT